MRTLNEYIKDNKSSLISLKDKSFLISLKDKSSLISLKDNKSSLISLNEKLIINKNYKNINDTNELFDNIEFKYKLNELRTNDDIFSIMADYIRDHNIRRFSDFDSYREASQDDRNACLTVFNKSIKEIDIFQKTANDTYKAFIIFEVHPLYIFKEVERSLMAMHVLKNVISWNDANDVEYYEISKEIFDDISELYNGLIKK